MATILDINGYTTMERCRNKIVDYVKVCAYKTLCAAASPASDPNDTSWYAAFLDEERKSLKAGVDKSKIIGLRESKGVSQVKTDKDGFILHCEDLDMQAFMKIFCFRPEYREMVLQTFGIKNKEAFIDICHKLRAFRNDELAHEPTKKSEEKLDGLTPEQEQELINQYNQDIAFLLNFLRFFPKFSADRNASEDKSYYNKAHNEWCEANTKLHIKEVELETVIQQENLTITVQTLEDICEKCGIPVFILDGKRILTTNDYKKTAKLICSMAQIWLQRNIDQSKNAEIEKELEISRAKESSNRKHFGAIIALCIAFIGILVVLLLSLLGSDNDVDKTPENTTSGQVQQSQQGQQSQPGSNENDSSKEDTSSTDNDLIPDYDGPAFISGTGSYSGLTFQVNQMKATGILINYTNADTCDYSLGWVGGAQVDVKTSVGTFTVSTGSENQKLLRNSCGSFSVNMGQELMGKILSITVREVKPLSASGLPNGQSCTIEIPIQEGDPTSPNAVASKFIRGQVDKGGLQLTVDQKLSSGIRVQYANNSTEAYSLGWVQNAQVTIKTSDGNVEGSVTQSTYKIEKGATGTFVVEVAGEITGAVEEIVIHNVNTLTSSGLPSFTQSDPNITIPITQTEE